MNGCGEYDLIMLPISVEDVTRNIQDKLLSVTVVGKVSKDISASSCLPVAGVHAALQFSSMVCDVVRKGESEELGPDNDQHKFRII